MEWLILILVVPAILVPVVLLYGFSGCSFKPAPAPIPPTVTATPINVDHVTVSWQNADLGTPIGYHFVRLKGAAVETDVQLDAATTSVDDKGLEAGTDYTYQVSTVFNSSSSGPTAVTVTTFRTAFDVAAFPPTDQSGGPGEYCFVQRISVAQLHASGGTVGIKLRGAPAGNVAINRLYISGATTSGNAWDSAADLTPVFTSAVTLADDTPLDLAPIAYSLDQTQDLIVAFDLTVTVGAPELRFFRPPGVALYLKAGVQQASMAVRDPDYLTNLPATTIYFVSTIGAV